MVTARRYECIITGINYNLQIYDTNDTVYLRALKSWRESRVKTQQIEVDNYYKL